FAPSAAPRPQPRPPEVLVPKYVFGFSRGQCSSESGYSLKITASGPAISPTHLLAYGTVILSPAVSAAFAALARRASLASVNFLRRSEIRAASGFAFSIAASSAEIALVEPDVMVRSLRKERIG